MRLLILWIVAALLAGCSGTFSEARLDGAPKFAVSLDPPECVAIETARRNWDAAAKGAAIAAGATGISVIPIHGEEARVAVIASGVAVGIFAAISVAEADAFAKDWVRQCGATGVR